jgi:hypothetical protein
VVAVEEDEATVRSQQNGEAEFAVKIGIGY